MKSFWNFLKRNKLYGAVNLIGLSVSMAFVLLLAVYVQRQLSTDSFQANADRIYLVSNEESLNMAYWLDKHLKNRFPEIEKGCCVAKIASSSALTVEGELVYGSMTAADSSFFDMFSYDLVAGDKKDWAVSRDRCMVSQKFASTCFGEMDPVGRVVNFIQGGNIPLTICGVYKDFGNSVLGTPDVLVRGELLPKINSANNESMNNAGSSLCFVMTWPEADLRAKHDEMLDFLKNIFWIYKSGGYNDVRLIPFRDLYFLESGNEDWSDTIRLGNRNFVNLLLGMCLLLLLFAVLNYVNMTTALMGFRAKEVATRRLVGARKESIFLKIIGESIVICGVSMLLAILLAEAVAPAASRIVNYQISIFRAVTPTNVLLMLGFVLLLGTLAGLVPALLIQKAQPIEIVRGTLRFKTKTLYSKIIIVVQNAVAVVMLIATLTMVLQIRHLVSADLGYNTKDILVVDNAFGKAGEMKPLLDRLHSLSCVKAVGQGDGIPLEGTNNWTMELSDGRWVSFQLIKGDTEYFEILGLRQKQDNHQPRRWWLNEYAFKQIGIDETAIEFHGKENTYQIGGVYYDFKIRPLEEEQSAALIYDKGENEESNYPWVLLVQVDGDHKTAYEQVEAVTAEIFPGKLFDAHYMEDMIKEGFADESRVLDIVQMFTLLSMLVSALGLFAMSSYYMQQQVRSVSVKKVFGAAYSDVLCELVLSFMKMVGFAFALGVPVAWFIMRRWLDGYVHRIDLRGWMFVAAGIILLLITGLSVLYQSIRTARTNPAEALKKE